MQRVHSFSSSAVSFLQQMTQREHEREPEEVEGKQNAQSQDEPSQRWACSPCLGTGLASL